MSRRATAAITTICVGLAATTAVSMLSGHSGSHGSGKTMRSRTKLLRKTTGKALRQVGDFIDNVSYMMQG